MSPLLHVANALLVRMDTVEPAPLSISPTMTTSVSITMETSIISTAKTALARATAAMSSLESMITVSPTASLRATQTPQAPSLPENDTSIGAVPRSAGNGRVPIIVIVLIFIFALLLILAISFLVRSRTSKMLAQKQQMDEEARLEVLEARAFMPSDASLKRIYSDSILFGGEDRGDNVKELTVLTKVHSNQNDDLPHPLFHPELKRSRTLSYDQSYPRAHRSPGTSHGMSSRTPRIDLPNHPLSPRSPFEFNALSQYTTMQTRVPKPPSIQVPFPEESFEPFIGSPIQAVKSVWSSPTASLAPTSPSIYSEFPTRRPQSLRPSPSPSQTPQHQVMHETHCPFAALAMANELRKPLPKTPSVVKRAPLTLEIDNQASAPLSPEEPRSYSPVLALYGIPEPEPTFYPPSRRPSLAELNAMNDDMSIECPLGLERVEGEVKIEKWLDANATTQSAFGSILGESGRRLSTIERGRQVRKGSVKLSPIRDMRPSWARTGSAQRGESKV